MKKEIENIIIRYVNKSANSTDLHVLTEWIKHPSNQSLFNDFVKTQYAVNLSMNQPDPKKIREGLRNQIQKEKSTFYRLKQSRILRYAAVATIFLGVGLLFPRDFFDKKSSNTALVSEAEDIMLTLADGTTQVISEDTNTQLVDSTGNVVGMQVGNQLVYNNEEVGLEKVTYNTLSVPYGKKFELLLSDGTKVHLNSGSSLKYPVKFLEKKDRQIYLTGEVFLDVAKDKNRPFILNAGELDVRVLGTRFNVSSYPEDKTAEVVLLEGSVELEVESSNYEDKVVLEPGFKGSYNKTDSNITKNKVITQVYTSWMDGELFFRNMTFENIRKKLERHYNITIINENKELSKELFNGSFRDEPIERVLEYFRLTHHIEFTINTDQVIIK